MSQTLNRVRALVRAQTILSQIEIRSKAHQGALFSVALVLGLIAVAMLATGSPPSLLPLRSMGRMLKKVVENHSRSGVLVK